MGLWVFFLGFRLFRGDFLREGAFTSLIPWGSMLGFRELKVEPVLNGRSGSPTAAFGIWVGGLGRVPAGSWDLPKLE